MTPVSSLSLRKAGTFSPSTRGPIAISKSDIVPRASTLAGFLASLAADEIIGKCVNRNEPFECNRKIIKRIRGPFLVNGNDIFITIDKMTINLDDLVKIISEDIKEINALLQGKVTLPRKKRSYLKLKRYEESQEDLIKSIEIIGISLERDKKTVKEGMLYLQERIFSKISYFVEAEVNLQMMEGIYPFGGDSGAVKLERTEALVYKKLESIWNSQGTDKCLILNVSPIIITDNLEEWYNMLSSESLEIGIVNVLNEIDGFELESEEVKQVPLFSDRVEVYSESSGWDATKQVPRPWYPAIRPGLSVIGRCDDWKKVYLNGAGKFSDLGYGTLLPIPFKGLKQ